MNPINKNRYNPYTMGTTLSFCKELEKDNNVPNIIQQMKDFYIPSPVEESVEQDSNDTKLEDREVKAEDLYSDTNIDQETATFQELFFLEKTSKEDMEKNKELYEKSLKTIQEYYEKNELTEEENFLLYLFEGGIASHLGDQSLAEADYLEASKILTRASMTNAPWIKNDANLKLLQNKLQARRYKHAALQLPPLSPPVTTPCTSKDILLSKSYLAPGHSWDFPRMKYHRDSEALHNVFDKLFESLQSTKFSKLISKVNALDALEHPRFNILFLPPQTGRGGSFNLRNTVRIHVDDSEEKLENNSQKGPLLHELTHKAIQQIFDNNDAPYFKDDAVAKSAYRNCMKQVLINVLNITKSTTSLDLNTLNLNELVQLCFGQNRILSTENVDQDVVKLIGQLKNVFGAGYPISSLDSEFITNVTDCITSLKEDSACHKIIQPLMDYIDAYVIPEMEKYINEHPSKDQLID